MRKDLKIGMAIGAVLLVLVIVFMVTKPDGTDVANAGAGDTSAVDGTEGAAPADGDAVLPETAAPGDDEPAAEEAAPPARPRAVADANPADRSDPFAPGADGNPAENDDAVTADGGGEAEAGGGGTNWAKLLESGGDLAPLRTVTPPPADRTSGGSVGNGGTPATPAIGGTPAGAAEPSTPTGTPPADTVVPFGAVSGGNAAPPSPVEREPATPDAPTSADNARIPTPDDTANGRTHVMKKGETYTSIAKLLYGDGRHYLAIQKANPDLDPERIRPGTVINLPDPAAIRPAADAAAPAGAAAAGSAAAAEVKPPLDPKTQYEVKSNDSLHKIASSVYGTSTMWEKIYELNRDTIGDDPAKLKLGTVLKLPPNPNDNAGTGTDAATGTSTATDSAGESAAR